jgi:hypothetical protein
MKTTIFVGGDVLKNKAFKHILSIGFEIETVQLIKLTKITLQPSGTTILLNTDSSQKDIDSISNGTNTGEDSELRRQETFKLNIGKDASFHITNDMSTTPFTKRLSHKCHGSSNHKNKLYKFVMDGQDKSYDIHFLMEEANMGCSIFSDVEWVATYYKPKLHSNVIMETFSNTIKTLLTHLDALKPTPGEFILKSDSSEIEDENIGKYNLYHMSDSNLYYLKTNDGGIDTIYTTIQMTFSAHVSNIFFIMKQLTEDTIQLYPALTEMTKINLSALNNIQSCVEHLIKGYNEKASSLGFKIPTTNKSARDKLLIREIYNYISLILYKLYVYYNKYRPRKINDYFKNTLSLNVRHSNYDLYIELKRRLSILFDVKLFGKSETEKNEILSDIIKSIFIQETILLKYLLLQPDFVRKNGFNNKGRLDENNRNYGDPYYSLVSYFDFFENPTSVNRDGKELIYTSDWFEYKQIDSNSTRMDIKKNVVLIEFRSFPKMIYNAIASILNENERAEMDKLGKFGVLSVKTLKQFIERYSHIHRLKDIKVSAPVTKSITKEKMFVKTISNTRRKYTSTNKSKTRKYTSNNKSKTRKFSRHNIENP